MTIILLSFLLIGLSVWRIIQSSPGQVGRVGERRVSRKLDWLPKEYRILNDILLKTPSGTTQIDHIVVSPYAIFIIETKNYKGWILGHENAQEWKQSLLGKKKLFGRRIEQHKFRNPILQNQAHVNAIKRLVSPIGNFPIIPIVVFSDKAELKITVPNHIVITWSRLRKTMKKFHEHVIPDSEVHKIVAAIRTANITDKKARKNHAMSVRQKQERTKQMLANRICPLCHSTLVVKKGKYGRFWGCSNYPASTFTTPLAKNQWRFWFN